MRLRSAGVLRQSLGQHDRAIKHYGEYARRFKDNADARDVAFHVGLVHEERRDWRAAAAAFADYAKTHPGDPKTVEAMAREANAHFKAGNDSKAREVAAKALAVYGKAAAAERENLVTAAAPEPSWARTLLRRAGALHPGRAGLPRLRAPQDRRQAQAAGQGAGGESQALEQAKASTSTS